MICEMLRFAIGCRILTIDYRATVIHSPPDVAFVPLRRNGIVASGEHMPSHSPLNSRHWQLHNTCNGEVSAIAVHCVPPIEEIPSLALALVLGIPFVGDLRIRLSHCDFPFAENVSSLAKARASNVSPLVRGDTMLALTAEEGQDCDYLPYPCFPH